MVYFLRRYISGKHFHPNPYSPPEHSTLWRFTYWLSKSKLRRARPDCVTLTPLCRNSMSAEGRLGGLPGHGIAAMFPSTTSMSTTEERELELELISSNSPRTARPHVLNNYYNGTSSSSFNDHAVRFFVAKHKFILNRHDIYLRSFVNCSVAYNYPAGHRPLNV